MFTRNCVLVNLQVRVRNSGSSYILKCTPSGSLCTLKSKLSTIPQYHALMPHQDHYVYSSRNCQPFPPVSRLHATSGSLCTLKSKLSTIFPQCHALMPLFLAEPLSLYTQVGPNHIIYSSPAKPYYLIDY